MGSTGTFVGINSTTTASTLYFIGVGTGVYHSLTTNHKNVLKGSLSRSLVTVSTSSTHGLQVSDNIVLSVNPGVTTTINVAYKKNVDDDRESPSFEIMKIFEGAWNPGEPNLRRPGTPG